MVTAAIEPTTSISSYRQIKSNQTLLQTDITDRSEIQTQQLKILKFILNSALTQTFGLLDFQLDH